LSMGCHGHRVDFDAAHYRAKATPGTAINRSQPSGRKENRPPIDYIRRRNQSS